MRAHSLSHTHTHSLTHTHARTFTHAHTHIRTGAHARAPFAGNASGDDETVAKYLEIGEARPFVPFHPLTGVRSAWAFASASHPGLWVRLFVCLIARLSVCLFVRSFVCPSVVCLFVRLFVCLFVCLSVRSANLRSGFCVCLWTAGHRRVPPREDRRAQVAAAAARAPICGRAYFVAAPIL